MRRFVGLAACGLAAIWAAQAGGGSEAVARAGLAADPTLGHLDVASVVFNIQAGTTPSGELSFAGEGHSHDGDGLRDTEAEPRPYPHIVVVLRSFTLATVRGNKLEVFGKGVYNNDDVLIEATARDGGPNGKGDKFELICKTLGGVEVYHVRGNVISGDISIHGGRS